MTPEQDLELARVELEESRRRREEADLATARRELETASIERALLKPLEDARRELERSRARLRGRDERKPVTFRRPPAATLEKRRAKAKAAKRARRKARA